MRRVEKSFGPLLGVGGSGPSASLHEKQAEMVRAFPAALPTLFIVGAVGYFWVINKGKLLKALEVNCSREAEEASALRTG